MNMNDTGSIGGSENLEKENKKLQLINRLFRHDIRNDLNIVKLNAEELRKKYGEDEQIETIINKTDHMCELTILARDIAESIQKETTKPIDLKEILEKCTINIRETHPNSEIKVDGEIPNIKVKADKLLSSLFENLIQNGIQHNDKQTPKIEISVNISDNQAIISIADNGPGIPDDMKEKIFKLGEKNQKSSGTGLGLFLVDTLTSNYNGDVWIEDNQPEGCIFEVELQKV